ncbi:two-component system, OmpR family, heavy metal sensor histidine kinase CusS [Geopseudomonas sagittaria]|uniref:Sensor protein n=1 Tax=Geopseudomonas sagittaria TaxID=1135990 RepID=A0A1I5Q2Q3_9GAMM|nr:heavy metal sensor histidine kinase [Pseudomonas sagittaria]SFP40479.1 two-component system, OmpR family, heavy metal sensor histidine kinase CusS [Pseudomonas sagittaria]
MIRRPSLTTRLSLLFMLALTGVLLAVGLTFNLLSREHFVDLDRHALHEKLQASQRLLGGLRRADQLEALGPQLHTLLGAHQDLRAQILAADGRVLFAEPSEAAIPARFRTQTHALWEWWEEGRLLRGMTAQVALAEPGQSLTLLLALDVTHHADFFAALERWLWIALGVCALLSAGLGWLVARSGLRPLREVTQVAATVSARSLKERIPEAALPVELRPLVSSFNGMLERLDESFVRLANFSADIAHELRTPLTQLMTHTEVVLTRARSLEEYQDALYANLDDLKRMARMIDDMLFLAKADNGLIVPARRPLALHELVDKLLDYYRLLAEEHGIALQASGRGLIAGDEGMLRRALSNLLSNALRYTSAGGSIRVAIAEGEGEVMLSVENPGPSIPAEHLGRLFDRFYRVAPADREGGGNAGLGLAITRSIVEAHGGRIRCASADGITRFELAFPAAMAAGPL